MAKAVLQITSFCPLCSYREASVEVIEVMSRFAVIERASIDEAYMDLTAAVQQRLKNMTDKQIEPSLLRTTYIQGYPQSSPAAEESAEDTVSDKGRLSAVDTESCRRITAKKL